jgi:hypothetical protein
MRIEAAKAKNKPGGLSEKRFMARTLAPKLPDASICEDFVPIRENPNKIGESPNSQGLLKPVYT